jgi:hypothetical protein
MQVLDESVGGMNGNLADRAAGLSQTVSQIIGDACDWHTKEKSP